ncbi:P-loop containing nucleoside triphosphate hydrolase protein [Xylariaceae sp. FL1272]|nr:P-loop containing nucleoside triphosphate hydrolase protein [Xylariaceae sp. FL1272]
MSTEHHTSNSRENANSQSDAITLITEEIIGVLPPYTDDQGTNSIYDIISLKESQENGKSTFKLCRQKHDDRFPQSLSNGLLISDGLPEYLQPSEHREVSIVVSTASGTEMGLGFYEDVLEPLLRIFGLTPAASDAKVGKEKDNAKYRLVITTDADSVKAFAREVSGRKDGVEHTIVLLSGDGGIIDMLNGQAPANGLKEDRDSSRGSKDDRNLPLIVILPFGTGDALFNSIHKTAPKASVLVQGLRTLLRGKATPLPSFQVSFPHGSTIITYAAGDPASAQGVNTQAEETAATHLQKQTKDVSSLYGVVVASYGFHSQLVWESDTPEYRKHGAARFQMVAQELLKESHAYRASVEIAMSSPIGSTLRLDRDRHAYILATLVSNLEQTFCISPASQPLDGQLRLVHFGPVDGEKTMQIMMAAYDGGKHVDEEALDIEGLNITVKSTPSKSRGTGNVVGSSAGESRKGKLKSEGIEILNDATLRLKAGQCYALIGRNGTGKSSKSTNTHVLLLVCICTFDKGKPTRNADYQFDTALLKAIAQKLIPGVPEETRVVILQQTTVEDSSITLGPEYSKLTSSDTKDCTTGAIVLEEVIERATARQEAQREIDSLSRDLESPDPFGALKGLRKLRYARLQKELFLKDKDARLRSGSRGMQARKALVATEKKMAEFRVILDQTEDEIAPETLAKETSEATEMLANLRLQVEPSKMAVIESRAKRILSGLGFSETAMQKRVSSLSGGWKMRTSLAATLLQEADILILDEPTNFLDLLGIIWLQQYLTTLPDLSDPPTLILVSHDRDFLSICTDLLIIRDHSLICSLLISDEKSDSLGLSKYYHHGDLPSYESAQAEKKIHLTKMKAAQDKQKEHIQQTIQRNMREGKSKDDQNKIRQAKSRQKKLDDRWGVETSAKGGRFKLSRDLVGYHFNRRADINIPQDERPISFVLPQPSELRFPGALLSLEKVSFSYPQDPKKKVLQDVTLSIHMGDRIGVLGLNGSGKSTFVKLLVAETRPSSGILTSHPRLKLGYYSQHAVEELQRKGIAEPGITALALLARETATAGMEEGEVRSLVLSYCLLGALGLPGRLASDVPIRRLSGGQLVRLELARILWSCPHCLILDEATTHLDYETAAAMREALRRWEGAVVVVSHDRWFMRSVVEGIVAENNEAGDPSDEEDEISRRRLVYRLRLGQLDTLSGGVQQFETSLEKRVAKLMNS